MGEPNRPVATPTPATPYAPLFDPTSPSGPIPPQPNVKPKKCYEIDGRDLAALFLAWAVGVIFAMLLTAPTAQCPGLGLVVLVAIWYGVLLWYRGLEGFFTRSNLLLFAAVAALTLCFALWSNQWLRWCNLLGLLGLMTVQMFEWPDGGRQSWYLPSMLAQRALLLLEGLVGRLSALVPTVQSFRRGKRTALLILCGLGLTVPVALVVVPLLLSADDYFALLSA